MSKLSIPVSVSEQTGDIILGFGYPYKKVRVCYYVCQNQDDSGDTSYNNYVLLINNFAKSLKPLFAFSAGSTAANCENQLIDGFNGYSSISYQILNPDLTIPASSTALSTVFNLSFVLEFSD